MEVADASRQLAMEARRDGSSMKTIAVLTMLFLPATFFATLLSMPSFEEKQPGMLIKIYLACTVPVTVSVFILWAAITQREAIRDLSDGLRGVMTRRRTRKSEGSSNSSYPSSHSSSTATPTTVSCSSLASQGHSYSRGTAQSIRRHSRDEEAGSSEGTL